MKDIADLTLKYNIDALIVSNTTIQTPKLLPGMFICTVRSQSKIIVEYAHIAGGLSGRPVRDVSTTALKKMYQLTGGKVTLVGCGGVSSGKSSCSSSQDRGKRLKMLLCSRSRRVRKNPKRSKFSAIIHCHVTARRRDRS